MNNVKKILQSYDSWRTQYNPLRGLTITKAVSLLEAGMRGEFSDLQWTYEFIEQTDPDLLALVERRTSALCEMDWNIKIVNKDAAGFSQAVADKQSEALRRAYEKIDNIYEVIEHCEMAAFRGFSIAQPHQDDNGEIRHIEPLDHWNFVRDGRYGSWAWNPRAQALGFAAIPAEDVLEDEAFIIREVRRPVDRIGLIKYVRANLSEKDWDSYVEIYGIPAAFVIGPEDVPDDKQNEYRNAAEAAAQGQGGYLPHGSDVKFPNEQRGTQPFETRLDWLSKKLVLAGTGGMLTMLTESGSGTLAGGAHQETFKIIARSEAQKISELFQQTLDKRILSRVTPDAPRLAYFDIAAEEERDVGEIVEHVEKLKRAGYQVEPEDVAEKTGYRLTQIERAEKNNANVEKITNRLARALFTANREEAAEEVSEAVNERLTRSAIEEFAQALSSDLAPLRNRIDAALALEDDQAMLQSLAAIPDEMPDMLQAMCRDPETERALERSITAALFNGMAEGAAERRNNVQRS